MLCSQIVRTGLSVSAIAIVVAAEPALAGRTVIDGGGSTILNGYCSPNTAGSGDCLAYLLPSAVQIGDNAHSSFYVNSNGTVSFGSIQSFLTQQNSGMPLAPETNLGAYGLPIFSPYFSDGPGLVSSGYDGNLVARTVLNATGFTTNWFSCNTSLSCGLLSFEIIENTTFDPGLANLSFSFVRTLMNNSQLNDPDATDEQNFESGKQFYLAYLKSTLPIYTMTFNILTDGFQIDYSYNAPALGSLGTYGFSLPTGSFQATGSLENRTYLFNTVGSLVSGVPEPGTWATMLLGFGAIGFSMRRSRRAAVRGSEVGLHAA